MNRNWFVYIITNYKNTVFYIGITNNLIRRVLEHKKGTVENSFSKRYRLYKLVWFQEFNLTQDAIAIEKKIKGWKRDKKLKLIQNNNKDFNDLFSLR